MKHTVVLVVCGSFIAARPAAPGSQIRGGKADKRLAGPAGEEAKEVDLVGGGEKMRKRGQAQYKNLGSIGESMFERIGNSIGSCFIFK